MPKIITTKRKEGEVEQAQNYIRTHILFPSALLGLLAMVVGVIALVFQLIAGTYDVFTFAQSSGLILIGIILGWGQTKYHKYILREHPTFFASRMKGSGTRSLHRMKKHISEVTLEHRGRSWVPLWYIGGIGFLLGVSIWSVTTGSVYHMAAFSLPWAGFFWGKMFSWRGVIDPPSRKGKKGR